MPKGKRKTLVIAAAVAVLMATSLTIGLRGIDFGKHWDEHKMVTSIQRAIETQVLLPGWYNYPSLWFLVGTVAGNFYYHGHHRSDDTTEIFGYPAFYRYLRSVFLLFGVSVILWTVLISYTISENHVLEAIFAGSLLAGSWEFSYHSRFIAPDIMMTSMGILCCLFALLHIRQQKTAFLVLSAIFAGLAGASKYTGAIFIVVAFLSSQALPSGRRWLGLVNVLVIFAIVFVLITPGAIFETKTLVGDILFEQQHYAKGHRGYTVTPGLPHLSQLTEYLSQAALSRFRPLSLTLFTLAVIGFLGFVITHFRGNRPEKLQAFIFLVPLLYFLYFSTQRVMLINNYQVLIPFLCVFAARGTFFILDRIRNHSAARLALTALLIVPFLVNTAWLFHASESIRNYNFETLRIHPDMLPRDTKIWVSQSIEHKIEAGVDVEKDIGKADVLLCSIEDLLKGKRRKRIILANHLGNYTLLPCGPFEINFDYYPSWAGHIRPFLITRDFAEKAGYLPQLKAN